MNEEILRELKALRDDFGKSQAAIAKIATLETLLTQRGEEVTKAMKDIEVLRGELQKSKDEMTKVVREARLEVARKEGVVDREHALTVLGGVARQIISRKCGMEIPPRFEAEQKIVRDFMAQRATLEAGATTGSYLVPTITATEIISGLEEVSELISMTDFRPDLPGNIDLPHLTQRPTLQHARATVDANMTKSDPAFGRVQMLPAEGYIYFGVDNRLLEMSSIALGSLMFELVREGITEGLANDLLNGDGTSTYNSITGLLNETNADYVVTMANGKKSFTDITAQVLISAMSGCLKRARARGSFLMSEDTLGILGELNREGKVPVVTYSPDGTPLVFRRPVIIDEGMPDIGLPTADQAGKAFIGFGDLKTFAVGLVNGIKLASSTDALFAANQTAFRGTINFDIKRKAAKTYKIIKTAAASLIAGFFLGSAGEVDAQVTKFATATNTAEVVFAPNVYGKTEVSAILAKSDKTTAAVKLYAVGGAGKVKPQTAATNGALTILVSNPSAGFGTNDVVVYVYANGAAPLKTTVASSTTGTVVLASGLTQAGTTNDALYEVTQQGEISIGTTALNLAGDLVFATPGDSPLYVNADANTNIVLTVTTK